MTTGVLEFFSAHGFVIELFFSCLIFVLPFSRRSKFGLRLAVSLVVIAGLSVLWYFVISKVQWHVGQLLVIPILKFASFFCAQMLGIYFCFENKFYIALFTAIAAYSTQHAAYKLGELIGRFLQNHISWFLQSALYVVVVAAVYVGVYFWFRKVFRELKEEFLSRGNVAILAIPLVLITMIFQYSSSLERELYVVYALYDILSCLFILYIQYSQIVAGKREHEHRITEHMHYLEKQQYAISKENVEMFNMRMHDVKHVILGLKSVLPAEQAEELERAVQLYDTTVKTGNEVLDVIFTEKSLLCAQKDIRFERIVDGQLLRFMRISDIYSLFGNIIDNAIEAVQQLSGDRVISLMVRESRGMVFIHTENRFAGDLKFVQGLPISTKSNKMYHGFGAKSIFLIAEKYGGSCVMKAENNVFNLNILIPIPAQNAKTDAIE